MPNRAPSNPGSNAKVGAILQEFQEEKIRELNEERTRSRPKKNQNGVKLAIMTVACLTVWVGPEFMAESPTRPSEEVLTRGTKSSLFLDGLQLQAYRDKQGQLPRSLADAGIDDTAVTYYRTSDSTFRLTTSLNGQLLAVASEDNADSALVGLPLARAR